MIRILGGKVPAFSFDDSLEDSARQQLIDVANHPRLVGNPIGMPDIHMGYGYPIGGVAAFDGAILPYAVGSDITCGVYAAPLKLDRNNISRDILIDTMRNVRKFIPTGYHRNSDEINLSQAKEILDRHPEARDNESACEIRNVSSQLGTLGSSNHFLDILYDEK